MNQRNQSVFDLGPPEKLRPVEDLWEDPSTSPEDLPVREWQVRELEHRKAQLGKVPASGLSWEEVGQGIRDRHGR